EAGWGEAVAVTEGADAEATVPPELEPTSPLLFFARIARFARGHDVALLSRALHHGRQERCSPDGHEEPAVGLAYGRVARRANGNLHPLPGRLRRPGGRDPNGG